MKKLDLTKRDIVPLSLFLISLPLLITGLMLKSMVVIAGVTGLVIAWFLCIDHVIADFKMNLLKRVLFGAIIFFLPVLLAMYMSA